MFLADYNLTKGIPGAPVAHVKLSVDPVQKIVTGTATITQATPQQYDPMEVTGTYFEQQHVGLVITVNSTQPVIPGTPEFSSLIVIKNWGEAGQGWFWYFMGKTAYESGLVPATPVEAAVATPVGATVAAKV